MTTTLKVGDKVKYTEECVENWMDNYAGDYTDADVEDLKNWRGEVIKVGKDVVYVRWNNFTMKFSVEDFWELELA